MNKMYCVGIMKLGNAILVLTHSKLFRVITEIHLINKNPNHCGEFFYRLTLCLDPIGIPNFDVQISNLEKINKFWSHGLPVNSANSNISALSILRTWNHKSSITHFVNLGLKNNLGLKWMRKKQPVFTILWPCTASFPIIPIAVLIS